MILWPVPSMKVLKPIASPLAFPNALPNTPHITTNYAKCSTQFARESTNV
jgi:hypothetical protein